MQNRKDSFVTATKPDKPDKPTTALGQITFRLDPAFHAELIEMGEVLNLKPTELVKTMLAEAMPTIRERVARIIAAHRWDAGWAEASMDERFQGQVIPSMACNYAIELGKQIDDPELRKKAMRRLIKRFVGDDYTENDIDRIYVDASKHLEHLRG